MGQEVPKEMSQGGEFKTKSIHKERCEVFTTKTFPRRTGNEISVLDNVRDAVETFHIRP